jgi:2,4-didehydro-3-deoxy-L-rhamnonate hydrolase
VQIGNLDGRSVLIDDGRAIDIERTSSGRFDSAPATVYNRWDEFVSWARDVNLSGADSSPINPSQLNTPVPAPRQIFAIGLNYADHAAEANLAIPSNPIVFTKYVSSLAGPTATVRITGNEVDWEAELVVVIGRGGREITTADAWEHVAGLTVGQDLSDRTVQWWGPPAQFSLGKSFEGFAPVGPTVVTLDEIDKAHDRNNLRITCAVQDKPNGEPRILQNGSTGSLIFSIPEIISRLSTIVELYPGDLIFSGTPAGVGMGLKPPQYLRAGQTLTTEIEGLGTIRQQFV